jgi:hypothetical protein
VCLGLILCGDDDDDDDEEEEEEDKGEREGFVVQEHTLFLYTCLCMKELC